MADVIGRAGPCALDSYWRRSAFPALVHTIVAQQISTAAASTINRRVRRLFRRSTPTARGLLALGDEDLRGAGLSRQKIVYLRDLAERVRVGELSLAGLSRMSDEEVVEALTRVKGIGVWTAQVFMIFRLGRLDVLPVDDLGLQHGARVLYGLRKLPSERRFLELARPWRPYRSVGCWFLWQGRRLARGDELR